MTSETLYSQECARDLHAISMRKLATAGGIAVAWQAPTRWLTWCAGNASPPSTIFEPVATDMPLHTDAFIGLRPYLYHLTASDNIRWIRQTRILESAASMFAQAGCLEQVRSRRRESYTVDINGRAIRIRDQAPLHARNVALAPGWTFDDLVELLNEQVYFWPGDGDKPNDYGRRHFHRYAGEEPAPAVLRVPTAAIFSANPDTPPRFSRFNSGSPRALSG